MKIKALSILLSDEISFRFYKPGDETEIVPLLDMVFDDWQILDNQMDYWRWKYLDYPQSLTYTAVAVSSGRVVGIDHAIPIKIKFCDRVLGGVYGLDNMTHEEFRRRGINNKFFELKKEWIKEKGHVLSYFITDNPILINVYNERYDKFPYIYHNVIRVKDPEKHVKFKKTKKPVINILGYEISKIFHRSKYPKKKVSSNIRVSSITHFDDRINQLMKTQQEKYSFLALKDAEYLNWRYTDSRVGSYCILQAEIDEEVLGFIVLKIIEKTSGYPEGYVIDWMSVDDHEVMSALVGKALEYFDHQQVNAVRCLIVGGHPFERILYEHEFIDTRHQTTIYYYELTDLSIQQCLKYVTPDKVHWNYGDLHLF